MSFVLQKILVLVFFSASLFFAGNAMSGECVPVSGGSQAFCEEAGHDDQATCEDLEGACKWED